MKAYLFTGWISQFKAYGEADSCRSLIICTDNTDEAWARFEASLLSPNQAPEPTPTKVEKIVFTPMLGHLFTETGPVAIEWTAIPREVEQAMEADTGDDLDQGYWVDCNAVVTPDNLSADLAALPRELPEDVRSGLNWSEDRKHYYLVSALSPPPPPPEFTDDSEEFEEDDPASESEPSDGAEEGPARFTTLHERESAFPELAPREVVVLVQARNSVVAAWLWRKHAASTPLARNAIRIDPWCGAVVLEAAEAASPAEKEAAAKPASDAVS